MTEFDETEAGKFWDDVRPHRWMTPGIGVGGVS